MKKIRYPLICLFLFALFNGCEKIDFTPTGTIYGWVIDSSSTPNDTIFAPRVILMDSGTQAFIREDGAFEFNGLKPGTHYIRAFLGSRSEPAWPTARGCERVKHSISLPRGN